MSAAVETALGYDVDEPYADGPSRKRKTTATSTLEVADKVFICTHDGCDKAFIRSDHLRLVSLPMYSMFDCTDVTLYSRHKLNRTSATYRA